MASTFLNSQIDVTRRFDWLEAGFSYYTYGFHLKSLFGERIWRVSLDGGFTCPNVDGQVATGGCTFCDNRSFSPSRRIRRQDIRGQIDQGIFALRRRYGDACKKFVAYFQPATNTYGSVERLRDLYEAAWSHEEIIGLAIGTRPDCVPPEVLDLLEEMAGKFPLSVEYGMQTMHDASLAAMNRGHGHQTLIDAVERSRNRGFEICLHLLIGWPTESLNDVLDSADEVARLKADSVKLHNLYAVEGTPFGDQVKKDEVALIDKSTYVDWAVQILERLPKTTVIERLSAHAPPEYLIGPKWCLGSSEVRLEIEQELKRRETWQGKRCQAATSP